GAATTRDLVVTIHNTGTTPVDDPPLVLTAGKGSNPEGVVTPPRIGRIEPGARRTIRASVPINTLSVGSYTVKGRIGNAGASETFRAHTTVYPLGLFVLAILVLLALLFWIFNGVRRRVAARKARKRAARTPEPTADLVTPFSDAEDWENEYQSDEAWTDDEWADDEQSEDDWTDDERTE